MSLLLALTGGGGASYTLTANAGSYALTGSSASLSVGRKITADAGTYSITGSSATLSAGRQITANAGTYSITGGSAALSVGRKITANAGTYSISGGTAALSVGRKITGQAGVYSLTGGSAVLTKSSGGIAYTLTGSAGSYAVVGSNATLTKGSAVTYSGGYEHLGRRQTAEERRKERIRLGILPDDIVKAVTVAAEKAIATDDPIASVHESPSYYENVVSYELSGYRFPDMEEAIIRRIRILMAAQREEEEALLLLM